MYIYKPQPQATHEYCCHFNFTMGISSITVFQSRIKTYLFYSTNMASHRPGIPSETLRVLTFSHFYVCLFCFNLFIIVLYLSGNARQRLVLYIKRGIRKLNYAVFEKSLMFTHRFVMDGV